MKIVDLDGYAANPGDLSWDRIAALGDFTYYDRSNDEDFQEMSIRIGDADMILVNKVHISRELMEAAPNLKYIGELATGYNNIDIQAAKELGIIVTNIPAYSTDSVVQHTIALLLEITNGVAMHSDSVHDGGWVRCPDFCYWNKPLIELAGKTLGIIGYGSIGRGVGKVAKALGMRVITDEAHPGKQSNPADESETTELLSFDQVLAEADVISLHAPLTSETTGVINKENIAKMKDGVIILNTARGLSVVEQDLADALNSGKVAAAGIDVVSEEPMNPDNPLLIAKNCIITPHLAWAPIESRQRLFDIAEENIKAFMAGKPINVVNA